AGRNLPVPPQPAAGVWQPRRPEARGAHHGAARGRPPARPRRGRPRALGTRLNGRPPVFTIALGVALAITATWWQLAERRARAAESRLQEVRARLSTLTDSLRAATPPPATMPSASDLAELKSLGLSDPPRQILEDLARHPELIPFKGVDGGMLQFYPAQSALVNRDWAYGYFEDGHVAGRGLFEYRVSPGGQIAWKRVVAKLD